MGEATGPQAGKGKDCPAYQHGYKLYQHGEFEGARDALLESIDMDFANAPAWALLSAIYVDMDEPEHAAEAARQAVRSDLHNPEWRVLRALQVQLINKLDEARGEFAKAIELDSRCVAAFFNRAILEARLGEDDAALADLRKAIELEPGLWDSIDNYEEFDRLLEAPGFPERPKDLASQPGANNPFGALKLPKDEG